MNCKDIGELIVEHDGRIDRLDAAAREHVASCAPCAREAELARRVADEARRTLRVQAPAGFTFRLMDRLRAEERTVWQKLADRLFSRSLAPAWALGAVVLLAVGLFLCLPDAGPKNEIAKGPKRKEAPQAPQIVSAPVVAAADFTLDGRALAYTVAHSLRKGAVVDFKGIAKIETREDTNLMLQEGSIMLIDGVLAVSAPANSCKLEVATETTNVKITGTAYQIGCRCGVTTLSVERGSIAVQTTGGESFTLSKDDAVQIGADGRKMRPVQTGSGATPAGAAATTAAMAEIAGGPAGTDAVRLQGGSGTEATPVLNVLDKLRNDGINGK